MNKHQTHAREAQNFAQQKRNSIMEAKQEQKEKKTKKQRRELDTGKKSLIYYLSGGVLSEKFIAKQGWLFALIVVLLIFNVSNRYSCQQKITKIDRLKDSLKDLQYESLSISAEFTKHIKRSQVEETVLKKGTKLKTPNSPIIKIE